MARTLVYREAKAELTIGGFQQLLFCCVGVEILVHCRFRARVGRAVWDVVLPFPPAAVMLLPTYPIIMQLIFPSF